MHLDRFEHVFVIDVVLQPDEEYNYRAIKRCSRRIKFHTAASTPPSAASGTALIQLSMQSWELHTGFNVAACDRWRALRARSTFDQFARPIFGRRSNHSLASLRSLASNFYTFHNSTTSVRWAQLCRYTCLCSKVSPESIVFALNFVH